MVHDHLEQNANVSAKQARLLQDFFDIFMSEQAYKDTSKLNGSDPSHRFYYVETPIEFNKRHTSKWGDRYIQAQLNKWQKRGETIDPYTMEKLPEERVNRDASGRRTSHHKYVNGRRIY